MLVIFVIIIAKNVKFNLLNARNVILDFIYIIIIAQQAVRMDFLLILPIQSVQYVILLVQNAMIMLINALIV